MNFRQKFSWTPIFTN